VTICEIPQFAFSVCKEMKRKEAEVDDDGALEAHLKTVRC
jgi:hypothetical protein